jgi:hypothetical protein
MSLLSKLDEKKQALLLMVALKEGERAPNLLTFLSESRARELREPLEELLKISKGQRKEEVFQSLARLSPKNRESLINHADPAWVIESFRGESARILFLLLKELPKATVGRFLSELPKEMRKALKALQPSEVSKEIRQLIYRKFQERFPAMPLRSTSTEDPFEKLCDLNAKQLQQLLREMGLHEMSIAFSKVNRSATRAILHRLNVEDAKEVRKRIKKEMSYGLELQREAQLHILSLDFEKSKSDELALEIGFSLLGKAFSKEDHSLISLFIYKLPPRQGYILKRYIDLNASSTSPEMARKMRERVLDAFMRLHG